MKESFKNRAYLDDKFLNNRISASLSDMQNHQREKIRKYLAERPMDAELVKEQGCPDVLSPHERATRLKEELVVRAWQRKEHDFKLEIRLAKERSKAGQLVDILPLQQKLQEWEVEAKRLCHPGSPT